MHRNRYALLDIELSCCVFVLYSSFVEKRIAFFRRRKSVSDFTYMAVDWAELPVLNWKFLFNSVWYPSLSTNNDDNA